MSVQTSAFLSLVLSRLVQIINGARRI